MANINKQAATRQKLKEASDEIRSGGVYIYECSFCRQYHITHVRPERWRFKLENAKHYNFKNVTQ